MQLKALLQEGRKRLISSGCESARLDADLLLMQVLNCPRSYLITHDNDEIKDRFVVRYRNLISRRMAGEPIAYIVGYKEFWGLPFKVNKDVLIPRPDTELIVETALKFKQASSVLDLGTGSGAIILAIKHERPEIKAFAVDISDGALNVAKENAALFNLDVNFIKSFWFSGLKDAKFDLIVSNPPYIPQEQEIEAVVKDNEPHVALFGGNDGLYFYRKIFEGVNELLNERALLAFEMGFDQRELMEEALQKYFPNDPYEIIKDINGKDRMLFIYRNLK